VTRSKTVWFVLGAAVVLALAWVLPAVYAHGGDSTLIHACVRNNNGDVRIVSPTTSCASNETAVHWPGTSAPPSQGSIMVLTAGVGGPPAETPDPVCLSVGATCEYRSPRDGTIQNMRILIESNTYNGPAVVAIFVNGSPTLLSPAIPAGGTLDIDVPGIVDILDSDRISVRLDISAVPVNPFQLISLSVSYEIK
jgi:hypothetical protein